jgi:hypothetical protein
LKLAITAAPAAAGHPVVVEIGGIAVALHTQDENLRDLLQARYAGFIQPAAAAYCHFGIQLVPHQINEPAIGPDSELEVKFNAGLWNFRRGDFYANWDPEMRQGQIRQSVNPYSADAVLRIVHSLLLARLGGFLLHAASAVRNGAAFVFSGVSGAGKTTISGLAPPDVTLLTDELSYIQRAGDAYRAFGTPFAGELGKAGENISAPVSALFFLAKGPDNRIEHIAAEESVRLLLRNILFFANDPGLVNLVFQSACRFVEKIPVRKLVFLPDERVWEIIGGPIL